MITHDEQMDLFSLIARRLKKDVTTYAFGGTAMMFYGYRDETKDIDLLFATAEEREVFIEALADLGFELFNPLRIYIPEKLRDRGKPVMYVREGIRFDLFSENIFRTLLSPRMVEDIYALHEFRESHNLGVKVLLREQLVLLKSVTERDKDLEDMLTILKMDRRFDWQYLVDEAVWQHLHGDSWAVMDLEKAMKELKRYMVIDGKYFRQLYAAQSGREGQ